MPSLFKRPLLPKLRSFPLTADAVTILSGAAEFRRCLLEKIASATQRIYIVALYLQQDEAGQEILDALHAAKLARPQLEVAVVVDWLRAQRGLIGAGKQPGNSAWYQEMTRTHESVVPVYGVPEDMIIVSLDSIYPELKGKRLRGRLQGNTLVPFFDRAEWERLGPDREKPIVWVDDKLDAFLLQVQGSGRVTLPDGSVIRLSYAEQNGHPYKSIGKVLVDRGELTAAQATIPGIRNWAKANPGKLDDLLNANPSVVFFKENKVLRPQEGPVGAMGVPLTGKLSLAIDREKVPYGSPIWIESSNPVNNTPITQGTLAQDTGGAIRGRVRADYFWGTGEEAGTAAGLTRQPLKMWLIWPKGTPLPESGS